MDSNSKADDGFVSAGTFLRQLEQPTEYKTFDNEISMRTYVMELPGMRTKLQPAPRRASMTKTRGLGAVSEEAATEYSDLIAAVPSPTTSAHIAAKREATRFPAIMPNDATAAAKATSGGKVPPVAAPLKTSAAAAASQCTLPEAASVRAPPSPLACDSPLLLPLVEPSRPRPTAPALAASTASELYHSATSRMSTSTDDLSALKSAVMALKTATLATRTASKPPAAAAAPAPPSAAAQAEGGREPGAAEIAAVPAAVAEPAAALPAAPPPTSVPFTDDFESTPVATRNPASPGAPANTPATPMLPSCGPHHQCVTAAGLAAAFQQAHIAALMSKPPAVAAQPAPSPEPLITLASPLEFAPPPPPFSVALPPPSPAPTEYDGEDVVMGEAAPGRAGCTPLPPSGQCTGPRGAPFPRANIVRAKQVQPPSPSTPHSERVGVPLSLEVAEALSPAAAAAVLPAEALPPVAPPAVEADAKVRVDEEVAPAIPAAMGGMASPRAAAAAATNAPPVAAAEGENQFEQQPGSVQPAEGAAAVALPDDELQARGVPADDASAAAAAAAVVRVFTPASPTMSGNPLAARSPAPSLPAHSPAFSGASSGGISNNPLFAGTPAHPTPPSVTMLRPFSHAGAELHRTPSTGGSGAAAEGKKLAEQLHAVAERLQTPASGSRPAPLPTPPAAPVSQQLAVATAADAEELTFQFKDDVAALMQVLEARTPTSPPHPAAKEIGEAATPPAAAATAVSSRVAARASTVERPKAVPRRSSLSANDAPLLDLSGFDLHGNRRTPELGTPLAAAPHGKPSPPRTKAQAQRPAAAAPAAASAVAGEQVVALRREVASLQSRCAELSAEREEAASLLSGYQGSIAQLQDRHSTLVVRMQAEAALERAEADRLRAECAEVDSQFRSLYSVKYQPLKAEAEALRREADAMRARLEEAEAEARHVQVLRQEVSAAQQAAAAAQQAASAAKVEVAAARGAERLAEQRTAAAAAAAQEMEKKWAAKVEAEAKRAKQALAAKDAELASWRDKHSALARQHDDAVHRCHLAQAGRERKEAEVSAKEEELCALSVRVREVEGVLAQYKEENTKFYGVKERYKAAVASLEREGAAKEAEKATLAAMCNELMNRLEAAEGK